ncbi:flavodoxin family protein [Nesterenkonia sp. NBAIMH1]|uniref:flavodoxin family protein n=1 Tax=Nesterenkonia sp. NBAIMH1 TaxID=2600320 RepID=UPI0011B54956|nr:NAD(P)H-dependent oxidoreductase [Nesterenkonia sp. NBAIMH1]
MDKPLTAVALNCTLKPSPGESSTDVIIDQLAEQLQEHSVSCETVRLVDRNVAPGVEADMGSGDEWPQILEKISGADILIFATPTWLGHMSSVAQRALERLNAAGGETDEQGRPVMFGKVAITAVVGNEDGAHAIIADAFQGLNDIGFSIPAQGATYWNHEAMNPKDYKDLEETPEAVAATNRTSAANAVHLAHRLAEAPYPGQ